MESSLSDILTQTVLHIPAACIISRASTTEIQAVNDAAVELFGYQHREELMVLTVADITAESHRPDLSNNYVKTINSGLTTVKRYRRGDGREFEGQLLARPLVGHSDLAIAIVIDLDQTDTIRSGTAVSG